jgi:hypothetical protein
MPRLTDVQWRYIESKAMIEGLKKLWTETDVQALIGQSESIRREFKAGVMFDREPESKWREVLSKEISAFANTEGGELILGIQEEKRDNSRVASGIDGVPTTLSRERLLDLIQGNLSPFLPGIGLQCVRLSAPSNRVVVIIQVPPGSTAYQAKDLLYYGRSEFKVEALPDHEIRLRMQRGRIARAQLELSALRCTTADEEFQRRLVAKEQIARRREAGEVVIYGHGAPSRESLEAAKLDYDEYEFKLTVVNIGELTIRDFVLSVRLVRRDGEVILRGNRPDVEVVKRFRFEQSRGIIGVLEPKLFPGDRVDFPAQPFSFCLAAGEKVPEGTITLEWTIFLEDAAPVSGVIDVGAAFQCTSGTGPTV